MDGVMDTLPVGSVGTVGAGRTRLGLSCVPEPGSVIRAVAARYDVSASLLFPWWREACEGLLARANNPVLLLMQTPAPANTAVAPTAFTAFGAENLKELLADRTPGNIPR